MVMQQMARRMAYRVFYAGMTRPSSPGTGPPSPPRRTPPRRTQFFIDFVCGITVGFVKSIPKHAAVIATLFLGCKAVGIDVKKEFVNILTNGRWDLVEDLVEDE